MTQQLVQRARLWLKHLDEEAFTWHDALHSQLGNYGTTHEHIVGILDGLGNALYDAVESVGEEDRKSTRRAKNLSVLLDTVEQLAQLGNITAPKEHP